MRENPNMTTKRSHYVGVFDDRNDAELAARDLREKGFKDDQIGYAWRDEQGKTQQEGNKSGALAASGAGTGVVLGGIIGAAAALLIPGIGPVVSGGLLATALAGGATAPWREPRLVASLARCSDSASPMSRRSTTTSSSAKVAPS